MSDILFVALFFLTVLLLLFFRSVLLLILRKTPLSYQKIKSTTRMSGPVWLDVICISSVIVVAALLLWYMGRIPLCECGTIKLWMGNIWSNENSQQISDPYTFTHITHGFLFYALLWFTMPRMSFGMRLFYAVTLEAGWEIFENTTMIIDRYRETTLSLTYYGDSIINSVADSIASIVGFYLAARLPVIVSIGGIILLEVFLAWTIRDSLFLSILMLIYPVEAIKVWQLQQS